MKERERETETEKCYLIEWLKCSQLLNFEQLVSLTGVTQVLAPSQELGGLAANGVVDVLHVLRWHWFVVVAFLSGHNTKTWNYYHSAEVLFSSFVLR